MSNKGEFIGTVKDGKKEIKVYLNFRPFVPSDPQYYPCVNAWKNLLKKDENELKEFFAIA